MTTDYPYSEDEIEAALNHTESTDYPPTLAGRAHELARMLRQVRAERDDARNKLDFLAARTITEDGRFTFPDGDYVKTLVGKLQEDVERERDEATAVALKLRRGLELIAAISDKPANYQWYDEYGDPVGVDTSNNGDWLSFGSEKAAWEASCLARESLAATFGALAATEPKEKP